MSVRKSSFKMHACVKCTGGSRYCMGVLRDVVLTGYDFSLVFLHCKQFLITFSSFFFYSI